jgi:RNA polymerase sigma factor (sigma-70 family)
LIASFDGAKLETQRGKAGVYRHAKESQMSAKVNLKKLDAAMQSGTWLMFFMKRAGGNGGEAERAKLLEHYMPFAHEIARRFAKKIPHEAICGYDDLLQQCLIAMNGCLDQWEPSRGYQFTSFAGQRMQGACLDYLRSIDWCSRDVRQKVKAVIALRGQGKTILEVSSETGISSHEVSLLEKDTAGFYGDYFAAKCRVVDGEVVDQRETEIDEDRDCEYRVRVTTSSTRFATKKPLPLRTSRPHKLRDRLRLIQQTPERREAHLQSAQG